MNHSALCLFFCFFAHICFSQNSGTEKICAYLDTLSHNNRFMGTVGASKAGEEIFSKSVGFSDLENKTAASRHSGYKIGSISKTFTAVMIFQAIEKGKLELSTPLNRFFPAIRNAEKITIDHLLSHRSGIHNFTDNDFPAWATAPRSRAQMMEIIEKGGSDFEPDSRTAYSNSNYVILSYILEIIHKKTYAELLRANITSPLKLTDIYFGKSGKKDVCNSYKYFDKWRIEPDTDPSVTMGAGGIVSTPGDLNRFFHALFSGQLISGNSLGQMKTIRDGYGKGLIRIPFGNRTGYGHTGGIDGFSSISAYFPADQVAYSLTSNGANYVVNDISIAVLSGIYNIPFDIPCFGSINLRAEDLDKYLGVYSSAQLPIKLTVSKRGNKLVAQGTGQQAFDLEATREHIFRFDAGGIVLEFAPAQGTMVLKQGGASFLMKRE